MKATIFLSHKLGIIILVFFVASCGSSTDQISLVETKTSDIVVNDSIENYNDLLEYIDTTSLFGINDAGYIAFCNIFSCAESDSIVRRIDQPELALYAFYKLAFDECAISTEEAIEIINIFENSEDTLQVWITTSVIGKTTLAQEAANSIWENNNFPMTKEQESYVLKIRGF